MNWSDWNWQNLYNPRGGKPDTWVWELRGCYNQESWENCSLMNQFSDLGAKEDDSCLRISPRVIMVGLQEREFYVERS